VSVGEPIIVTTDSLNSETTLPNKTHIFLNTSLTTWNYNEYNVRSAK